MDFLLYLCSMKKLIYLIFLILAVASCKPQQQIVEVPVETVRTEYIHNTKIDSVIVRDSIDRWMKGDTMFIYKEHTKYKYVTLNDTVVRTDTIPKIIKTETIKEVKVNYIKWYQKALMWIGVVLSLVLTGYIIYKIKK